MKGVSISPSIATLLAADRQGSVLLRQNRGTRSFIAYDAFGFNLGGERQLPELRSSGQLRETTGFYMLGNGNRAYNSALRIFHSSDSLSPFERGGLNTYAYCGLDPVNWRDNSGRSRDRVIKKPRLETIYEDANHQYAPVGIDAAAAVISKLPLEALPERIQASYKALESLKAQKKHMDKYIINMLDEVGRSVARGVPNDHLQALKQIVLSIMYSQWQRELEIKLKQQSLTRWTAELTVDKLQAMQHLAQELRAPQYV